VSLGVHDALLRPASYETRKFLTAGIPGPSRSPEKSVKSRNPDRMADRNLRDEISNLEERVEALAESLERCRKIMLASKISMIVGGILMLTILLGLFGFDPVAMIVAATAIIGGIVL